MTTKMVIAGGGYTASRSSQASRWSGALLDEKEVMREPQTVVRSHLFGVRARQGRVNESLRSEAFILTNSADDQLDQGPTRGELRRG
jgi:hypothetical protein